MDVVGHSLDQGAQEVGGDVPVGLCLKSDEGELRGPVDRDEEVEHALCGADLCNVDVDLADRIVGEARRLGLIAFHLRQTADSVSLKAAV